MKKILFAGHSDDTVYVRADGLGSLEFSVNSNESPAATFLITHENEALLVHAHYDSEGTWYFGVGLVSEGIPLPAWRVAIGTDASRWNDYTAVLIIEVPLNAQLVRYDKEDWSEEVASEEPADTQHHYTT